MSIREEKAVELKFIISNTDECDYAWDIINSFACSIPECIYETRRIQYNGILLICSPRDVDGIEDTICSMLDYKINIETIVRNYDSNIMVSVDDDLT